MAGLARRACSTRGTYRSALYRLAAPGGWRNARERGRPFCGPGAALYSPASARNWPPSPPPSATRPAAARRWPRWYSASAPGCGPPSWWRCAAATSPGTAARSWFRPAAPRHGWCRSPRAMPGGQPRWPAGRDRLPFRPGLLDGGYKNFVTNFARRLTADPAAPRLTMSRCRSSFICGHLADGTPVGELLGDHRDLPGRIAGPLYPPRRSRPVQGRSAGLGQNEAGALSMYPPWGWISPAQHAARR